MAPSSSTTCTGRHVRRLGLCHIVNEAQADVQTADMVKGAYFHHSMLDHCTATYSWSTEWLGSVRFASLVRYATADQSSPVGRRRSRRALHHADGQADPSWQFVLFQPPAHQHVVPYIDPVNRTSNALAWSFPLHDFLARDYISPARAVPLARDGEFLAMGVEELDEHELVTQSIVHRRPMRNQGSFGKVLLRAAYQRRPLARWQGAHECFSRQTPESEALRGIVPHGARGQYRDVAGNQLKACQASKWIEPLRVARAFMTFPRFPGA